MLDHPYPEGTRVRHAGDDSVGALATGNARVVGSEGGPGGETTYRIRKDEGGEDTWPAYFTIPVSNTPSGRHSARTGQQAPPVPAGQPGQSGQPAQQGQPGQQAQQAKPGQQAEHDAPVRAAT